MTDTPSPSTAMPAIEASRVVADELRFKAKLAIGEQADASLRAVNRAREIWDVLGAAGTGAAVAKSSLVASTFFAPGGLLGAVGLGTAATPIGWVAFAALASGGACYGLYRLLGNRRGERVIEIPRYLNTPLDQLGLAIFDLIAPLAIRMAAVDGQIERAELDHLQQHLVREWGLDEAFVNQAIVRIIGEASAGDLARMARERSVFLHANPDCNHAAIAADVVQSLRQMLEAAGPVTPQEAAALDEVAALLAQAPPGELAKAWMLARHRAQAAGSSLQQGVGKGLSTGGQAVVRTAAKVAERLPGLLQDIESTGQQVRKRLGRALKR
ncbi:TerB family tellurite resistance protein [Ideonella oryzae]|uniref:TerB family tellurite resistance protein n=1 Tax=Ideonella oryzae TaxID=2937441 RepID=A0ABT1BH42_9BURK|nr:TerB family tellurite resistance protein [Ideonella oryzae]MCO5975403.1 TerB family tellurite resistance protein [Ideonella oryzae]